MAEYTELIKALRCCAENFGCPIECPRYSPADEGVRACVSRLEKDAAAAIEAIPTLMAESEQEGYRKGYIDGYSEAEAAQPHWVSVDERLPEVGNTVLVFDEWRRFSICKLDKEYKWVRQGGGWLDTPFVRYWMPIEPPKEEA